MEDNTIYTNLIKIINTVPILAITTGIIGYGIYTTTNKTIKTKDPEISS